ncbi:hypothetical protein KBC03_07315 [Patescibacteria group bacterium]|nr:hypothetical protein [Patescibacteria group bacterium]
MSHGVYDAMSGRQTTGSLMPTYITGNAMNYNSVVRFTSGNYLLMSGTNFNQFDNSIFVVFRTPHNS